MANKKNDPYAITNENGGGNEAAPPITNAGGGSESAPIPAPGERKLDEAGTVGGAVVDTLSLGHADDIVAFLKRLGLATDKAATQTTKEAMAENPKSAALGTGLAMALPVAGAEAALGKVGALAGEGIIPAIGRGALASGGVSTAAQAGRAATGGETDWTAPIFDTAFGGAFSGLGRAASRALRPAGEKAAETVRKTIKGVPEDFRPGNFVSDPVPGPGNIGEVAQTAPEALQRAGLGQQAADAERLLRETIPGGGPPTVPGRNAALDSRSAQLAADTSRMPKGAPAANAMDKQAEFELFKSSLGVEPSAAPPKLEIPERLRRMAGDALGNATIGNIPGLGPILSGTGVAGAMGDAAVSAVLNRITGGQAVKNPALVQEILMDPMRFADALKPEDIATLLRWRGARAAGAMTTADVPGRAAQRREPPDPRYGNAF